MEFIYSKRFRNSFRNIVSRHPKLLKKIELVLEDFENKLYDSKYFRKNFNYRNKKITELEFGGDWRILIEVILIDNKIYLLNIGTHSSLELSSSKKIKL